MFKTAANSADHATTRNYVDASSIQHFATTGTTIIVNMIGVGANGLNLDKITITLGSAANTLACADKLADVLYGNKFSGRGAIMEIGVAFSAGITTIAYAAV
tara:strand:+ start:406 stop:711 length:306 start_codon:yes stop_codon:yes gene_type:complete